MRKYKGIDVGRVIFACLIPILHIAFAESTGIDIIRQYISRLGVPFFFAVTGMFLYKSIEKYGDKDALKRYLIRVGRVLLIWLVIYSPILVARADSYGKLIQEILFKTPAFLWYLSSLLFAAIPFCLVKNRRILLSCALILYIVGTLFGDTYRWLLGGVSWYENIFLTTRNGIFFGLPLMCVGELTWKANKKSIPLLVISGVALIAEISFVGVHASKTDDRSMYILLPVFIYALVLMLREWNPKVKSVHLGGISTAIYVMQFGVITIGSKLLTLIHLEGDWTQWIIWVLVLTVPTLLYLLLKKTKIVKWLF